MDEDDDRLPGDIAAEIALDDEMPDFEAIRKLLALMVENQDTVIGVLIAIDEKLDVRKAVKH